MKMNNLKKLLALVLALAMCLALAACGSSAKPAEEPAAEEPAAEEPAAEEPAEDPAADGQTYTIGICQLVQHDALDAATQGFMDAINEALPGQVEFDEQNASGDIPTCATICNGFAAANVDLIMANATPALQAAVAATETIPVLGTSVTEYGVALGIENFDGVPGGNVSGTSDLAPLVQQAEMILELFPEAKTVGILYCSAEANSVYQVKVVTDALEAKGITVNAYSFADSNDVAAVTQSACADSDVIYIPTDNTAAACAEAIGNVVEPANVPVIAGEEGICRGCGVATLTINYYDLGRTTGEMAVKILTGEADISTMPIEYFPNPVKKYNPAMAEHFGLTMPEDYEALQ